MLERSVKNSSIEECFLDFYALIGLGQQHIKIATRHKATLNVVLALLFLSKILCIMLMSLNLFVPPQYHSIIHEN